MHHPPSHNGSYVGTGSAISISDPGFTPNLIRIWNDTDNDVLFEFYGNQASGLAIKQNNSAFTGSAPYSAQSMTITHVASPAGHAVYAHLLSDGSPYLSCNLATDTANKVVSLSGASKLRILHDASAASGGLRIYVKESDGSLLINNTELAADCFLKLQDGSLLKLTHDASASSNGVALSYDDAGSPDRLEATFVGAANVSAHSEVQGWKSVTPAGSLGASLSEIASGGIAITDRGFSVGTDSSLNESGKTYRYICFR